ncbi:MAG: sigma 54-interacting transcriptional regulator [Deltaproteobacteria bacterium]|nr:sigma 54-interacting transcriptional regulator [Deltaproteobacteria bacterium]
MLEDRLTILLIEDNPADTRLIKEMCLDCGTIDLDIQCESRLASGLARLRNGGVDAVLLDLNLPDSLGIETLTCVDTEFPEIPIIVLTGQEDEAIAVEAVKQGAQDYLVKSTVDGNQLARSIQYAIERKRMAVDLIRAKNELERRVEERTAELLDTNERLKQEIAERKVAAEELKKSEERFRAIFESANDFIFIKDLSLRYTHINPATAKLFGVPASEMLGKTAEDVVKKEVAQYIREADSRVLKGESIEEITTREIRGVSMTFHEVRVPMHNGSGEIIGICGISRDITDLNRLQDTQKFVSQEYRSEIMKAVLKQAAFAASTKSVVLLLGESGVGKDYLAKYIHKRSNYSSGSYYSINCAAVPLELAESELFGHEAGAFTGAGRRKRGLLELAEGGTLLLNEVGELSPALQAKFLTFLDTRTFTRVGGQQNIRVNARILAATNRDLQHEISIGRFRADLYYRLNVFSIRIPPLRERIEDLPILVAELLSILAKELQMSFSPGLAAGEMAKLYNYQWPGNIRELRNVLERAVILSGGGTIKVDIDGSQTREPVLSSSRVSNIADTSTLADSMENLSRAMIEEALTRSKGRKELAASYLGVSRYTLRRWIQKLGINVRK